VQAEPRESEVPPLPPVLQEELADTAGSLTVDVNNQPAIDPGLCLSV